LRGFRINTADALTRAVTAQVQPLLDPESPVDDPAQATCAIF